MELTKLLKRLDEIERAYTAGALWESEYHSLLADCHMKIASIYREGEDNAKKHAVIASYPL